MEFIKVTILEGITLFEEKPRERFLTEEEVLPCWLLWRLMLVKTCVTSLNWFPFHGRKGSQI